MRAIAVLLSLVLTAQEPPRAAGGGPTLGAVAFIPHDCWSAFSFRPAKWLEFEAVKGAGFFPDAFADLLPVPTQVLYLSIMKGVKDDVTFLPGMVVEFGPDFRVDELIRQYRLEKVELDGLTIYRGDFGRQVTFPAPGVMLASPSDDALVAMTRAADGGPSPVAERLIGLGGKPDGCLIMRVVEAYRRLGVSQKMAMANWSLDLAPPRSLTDAATWLLGTTSVEVTVTLEPPVDLEVRLAARDPDQAGEIGDLVARLLEDTREARLEGPLAYGISLLRRAEIGPPKDGIIIARARPSRLEVESFVRAARGLSR